jgi:anti-anti-sigma regulatory factor
MRSNVILPTKADTAAATSLLRQIRDLQGAALQIDAQHCQSIGALCANILVSAQHSWLRAGLGFEITGSNEIANDLMLLGVSDLLMKMEPMQ